MPIHYFETYSEFLQRVILSNFNNSLYHCYISVSSFSVFADSDNKGVNSGRLVACITTLFLFSKIRPQLMVKHAMTMQPYLTTKCSVSIELSFSFLLYETYKIFSLGVSVFHILTNQLYHLFRCMVSNIM